VYQKQLISLQKTLASLGINFQIESVGKKALSRFPCPKLREQIYLHGYPSGFVMDSHPNGFNFYGINGIRGIKPKTAIAHAGSPKRRNILYVGTHYNLDNILDKNLGAIYWAPWFTSKEDFNIMAKECETIRCEITKITKSVRVSNDFLRFILTDGLVKGG